MSLLYTQTTAVFTTMAVPRPHRYLQKHPYLQIIVRVIAVGGEAQAGADWLVHVDHVGHVVPAASSYIKYNSSKAQGGHAGGAFRQFFPSEEMVTK